MFKDFLNWAFAVTSDGNKKECVFIFKQNLIEALLDKYLTWNEFRALVNIVDNGIYLSYA